MPALHASQLHESKIIRKNIYNFSICGDDMISLATFHSIHEHDDLLNRHEAFKLKCQPFQFTTRPAKSFSHIFFICASMTFNLFA